MRIFGKNSLKWGLIGMACVVVIALILILGSGGSDQASYTSKILYYANGGQFANNANDHLVIGYPSGVPTLDIGNADLGITYTKGNISTPTKDGYIFMGWYETFQDEAGELIYEDGQIKLGEKYQHFGTPLQDDQVVILAAKWERAEHITVILAGAALTDKTGNTYPIDSVIGQMNFTNGVAERYPGDGLIDQSDCQFAEYYWDAECTQPVSWPIKHVDGQTEYTIYAKFIDSTGWTIVKTQDAAIDMLKNLGDATKKYYLASDIDMGGKTVTTSGNVAATVEGNGFTVHNFTMEWTNQESPSIFGTVSATAQLHDLNLRDVTLNVAYPRGGVHNVYLLFTQVADGAEISGLNVKASIVVTGKNVLITNVQSLKPWIVGDEQTLLTDGSVTAEATCTINGTLYQYPSEQG